MVGEAAPADARLIEREAELASIRNAADSALGGSGRVVVLEAAAGLGKTSLVRAAASIAAGRGMAIASARGSELEKDLPFGVARQLFDPLLAARTQRQRDRLLTGAARHATRALLPGDAPEATATDASGPVLHGLYWLTVGLAGRTPLTLVVDDAHWSDGPSLRWLAYLARRLEELPVLLVLAARPVSEGLRGKLLDAVMAEAILLRPCALSESAVAAMVRERLSPTAPDELCAACHRATRGNAFYLGELLASLASEPAHPATGKEAARIEALAPESVARAVRRRIPRRPRGSAARARAVAVLGDGADLRQAAELAGLEREEAANAADALSAADILETTPPLAFRHPIVRAAVHADLPPARRALAHERAARLLADAGADLDQVAAHLLLTQPADDPSTVAALRAAAARALGRGAPESAVELLRRALAEPPRAEERYGVLMELGSAESLAGDPTAVRHFEAALEVAPGAPERAATAKPLARALALGDRAREAVDILATAIDDLDASEFEAIRELVAEILAVAQVDASLRPSVAKWRELAHRYTGSPDSRARRRLLAALAVEAAMTAQPSEDVASLAERALSGRRLLDEETADSPSLHLAINSLMFADRLDQAEELFAAGIDDARRRGSEIGFALCTGVRAHCLLRRGDVAGAEAEARGASEILAAHGMRLVESFVLAFQVEALLDLGALDEARSALARGFPDDELENDPGFVYLYAARAQVRLAEGRPHEALADLEIYGRDHDQRGIVNPSAATHAWRTEAALAWIALGRTHEAERLAREELAIARHFGAPRALGRALRVTGLARGGPEGEACLREAVSVLEGSPIELELARALVDLGSLLAADGAGPAARDPLRRGLDLADRCGARVVAGRAWEALIATGARPRRRRTTGAESLTASERRVAEIAARGASNAEVAQALFVTLRTVELHLSNAYRKLGISSRAELTGALGAQPEAAEDGRARI